MRIGCLQFARRTGEVHHNMSRADCVMNRNNSQGLDLLVLPGLAFSGATPKLPHFAELTGASVTSLWTRTVASRYRCTVAAGYHEAMPDSPKTYQSVIVVSPQGETLLSGRHPLHCISPPTPEDIDNCDAGHIPGIGLAIVASVNDLTTLEASTELAHRISDTQPNVVMLSAAETSGYGLSSFGSEPNEPDWETVNRWMKGLVPLIQRNTQHETIFVFANCSGIQRGEVRVYGILSRTDRELLVVDTRDGPILLDEAGPLFPTEDKRPASSNPSESCGPR
ncbi:hypothetical protein PG984_007255 [Apiospora sp. TS-2023a]